MAVRDVRRYALALAAWAVALVITYALAPYLVKTVFIVFWPAVFVSAWYAGRGPAYLTSYIPQRRAGV